MEQLFGDLSEAENSELLEEIMVNHLDYWNEEIADRFGIKFYISKPLLKKCCDQAAQCLQADSFPQSPGPYKRIATVLVMGVLYPFVIPHKYDDNVETRLFGAEARQWTVRLMVLAIAPTASYLSYTSKNGTLVPLPAWKGFPSDHYKLEFFEWLRRLNNLKDAAVRWSPAVSIALSGLFREGWKEWFSRQRCPWRRVITAP